MPRCWVMGDAAIDVIEEGDSRLELPGGTGANISVALSRLGVESALITKIGKDPQAAYLAEMLERENVDTQHMAYSEHHRTGIVRISLSDSGERTFIFIEEPSADSYLDRLDIPGFEQGDWLCISGFMLSQRASREATFFAIEQAKAVGATVCVDANMRIDRWDDRSLLVPKTLETLRTADIAKMSEDELLLLTDADSVEKGIEHVRQWPARIKVITRAEKGAILLNGQDEFHVRGYSVPVVDMTGAGDAFIAALVSKLMPLESWPDAQLIDAIEFSNACGALVVGQKGAMSALPDVATVNSFKAGNESVCRH